MRISEAASTIENIKTAWIKGKVRIIPCQERVVYTICSYCYKPLKAETGWTITCTHCGEGTSVKPKCHFELFLTDESGVLDSEIYSPYAEKLLEKSIEVVYDAAENGMPFDSMVGENIENKEIVCFVKHFDKEFRGRPVRKFIVLRMFARYGGESFCQLKHLLFGCGFEEEIHLYY